MGATYLAVAAGHPLARKQPRTIRNWPPSSTNAAAPVAEADIAAMEKKALQQASMPNTR